ncbi:amidohydrolase family protein [Amycolatopsis japonica]
MSILVQAAAAWRGGELERNVTALVTSDRVVWEPPADLTRRASTRLDIDGVLVPGLVDFHAHTEQIDLGAVLAGGITGVRDLGGEPDSVFPLAARSRVADDIPRVVAAGPILTAPGGYPSDRSWAKPGTYRFVEHPCRASSIVADLAARGAVVIKVALHNGAGADLGDHELRAVVAAARGHGLRVVAHAEGAGETERALNTGVRELAHTPWTHRLPDCVIAACAASMVWTSTLDIHGWGQPTGEWRTAVDNLSRFLAAGGRIRYGTDLGNGPLPLGVNPRELQALQEAGCTSVGILRAIATSTTDLSAVPRDPLADVHVLTEAIRLPTPRYPEGTPYADHQDSPTHA